MGNMKIDQKLIYKALLPKKIGVRIHKAEEGGFWAEIKDFPGCRTQGDSLTELIIMLNDAVYAYLGIPVNLQKELGFYMPSRFIQKLAAKRAKRSRNTVTKYTLKDILNNQGGAIPKLTQLEKVV